VLLTSKRWMGLRAAFTAEMMKLVKASVAV